MHGDGINSHQISGFNEEVQGGLRDSTHMPSIHKRGSSQLVQYHYHNDRSVHGRAPSQINYVNDLESVRNKDSVYESEMNGHLAEENNYSQMNSARKPVRVQKSEVSVQIDEFESRFSNKSGKRTFKYPNIELQKLSLANEGKKI
jgi:hypothetical protein